MVASTFGGMRDAVEASDQRAMKLQQLVLALGLTGLGCSGEVGKTGEVDAQLPLATAPSTAVATSSKDAEDTELAACEARYNAIAKLGRAYGQGPLETNRERMLGRARGATSLFVREPARTALSDAALERERQWFDKQLPGTRVTRLIARNKQRKQALRALLLREGYLYAEQPDDAYELEARVTLPELFDEEHLLLTRGTEQTKLRLKPGKYREYVFDGGPKDGKKAAIVFGDRIEVADKEGHVASPTPWLHRDILGLAWAHGLERISFERITEKELLTQLRVGPLSVKAVLEAHNASLSIACLAEPLAKREEFKAELGRAEAGRLADARIREAVSQQTDEVLPFDRPRNEKGPDKDGQLRPIWRAAYLRGQSTFEAEGGTYPVFLPDGRPSPPQVCVDFVLDTYERAAGSWFAPRGQQPSRAKGRLDIDSFGVTNRRGVLGFMQFADSRDDLFDVRQFKGKERIEFARRNDFFKFIQDNVADFRAGDILAIHGLKRDERIHQHAILVEFVDPITGFPSGLADQMKAPRRRSWEGIMAEAPKRSLLYRARPIAPIRGPVEAEAVATRLASK